MGRPCGRRAGVAKASWLLAVLWQATPAFWSFVGQTFSRPGSVVPELPPGPRPRVARGGLRGWLKNRRKGAEVAKVASHAEENATSLLLPELLDEDVDEEPEPEEDPVAVVEPRREGFMRESQFWRWTGALGWSLDFILLCWALFLRKIGIIDQGQDPDVESLTYDSATYADLVASQLQEERYVSESNRAIETVLEGLGRQLESLRLRAEEIIRPTEEKMPNYDDVLISKKIGELQVFLEDQQQVLGRESANVLLKLQQKPGILRQLADEISPVMPERPNNGLLPEELPRFLEQSGLPVLAFLGVSFLVALLSRQFLRVVSVWRKNEEERKAEKVRKIQKARFNQFTRNLQKSLEDLAKGRLAKAAKGFDELAIFADRWASEPTWEELLRAELAAFWERWGPQAFRLEANIQDWTGVPRSGPQEQAKWVADRWFSSAKSVIKDFALDAVKAWGEEASKAAAAARAAQRRVQRKQGKQGQAQAKDKGLVIRIFGRWPAPEDWVNIANLPLAGDWREQALRLLLPSAKDVQDVPLLGPLSEQALTAVVSGQVGRAVKTSTWGTLTTDLWRGSSISSQKPFEIGYEVVEVDSSDKEEMCSLARAMPKSGTPGRVLRVNPDLESLIESLEPEPAEIDAG